MRAVLAIFAIAAAALSTGCASRSGAPPKGATAIAATTRPSETSIAMLTLDEIQPKPVLPQAHPSTEPSRPPPLDALDLYARARDSLLQNQRYTGINLLEKAIAIDPDSFELHYTLGRAYLTAGMNDKSLAAFQRAQEINPNDLDVQAELGRAYYSRKDMPRAIEHLRLARQTDEYQQEDALTALVDYRLAMALQRQGYDRAALEVYDNLLKLLQRPTPQMRANAEVAYLLARPETLLQDLARLYERRGLNEEALKALEFIAQRNPDDLANQARIVNLLITLNRVDDAIARAADSVRRSNAGSESLTLLRDTYRRVGRESEMVAELQRLHAEQPADRAILFALAESMESAGRGEDAESLLSAAVEARRADTEILSRLIQLLADRGETTRAARALIEFAAKNPESTAELDPDWNRLLRATRRNAIRIEQIQDLEVSAEAQAAKWYFARRVAQTWNREYAARRALERSVRSSPPFAPAYRAMASQIWADPSLAEPAKIEQTNALIERARTAGSVALADEIHGVMLLGQQQAGEALKVLVRARGEAQPRAPETDLALGAAYKLTGDSQRFEQLMWQLISEHPRFADAYATLFKFYLDQAQFNGARRVLSVWRSNLPTDVDARLLEATLQLRIADQREEAERALLALYRENTDDAQVLANMRVFYREAGQLSKFIELLEQEVARNPQNYVAVANLVDLYATENRPADAARVLDVAREAAAKDPDRLYFMAHLYQRLEQEEMTERVLQDVLKLDESFAPAGNDLGYSWADAGVNLDRAEMLIRRALEQEPENPMFLDSLGWVLYKRGRFEEARVNLAQSVAAQNGTDPVVLDHLGDVLYQLKLSDEAAKSWQQAQARLGSTAPAERAELKDLRLRLGQKLQQASAGEPVRVAPIVESPARPTQAKN